MESLCQFSDLFGRPGEGVHAIRLANIALVDVALTILAAKFTAPYLGVSVPVSVAIWFAASLVFHAAFCVDTALLKALRIR